ncbi:Ig-like domain-containing protein [Streptacidiphilus sp. ASG 303]|uniref:L,D-transpeptidase n=1 Tax=Streptacidiphilus sp. ASG 303 TaxID=2896847 RepID=UPI001E6061C6|nr:Ig-like domain-containing protein [Streptacidiphilus sp. ASG 303]MCD0481701.1 Ig-like domain-containing protein [Streptacidiphilus sp. ASG 303]
MGTAAGTPHNGASPAGASPSGRLRPVGSRRRRRGRAALPAVLAGSLVLLGSCTSPSRAPQDAVAPPRAVDIAPLVRLTPAAGTVADPSTALTVTLARGRLTDVTVAAADGRQVTGRLSADGRTWRSTSPLAAGARYTVRVGADDGRGGRGGTTAALSTRPGTSLLTAVLGPAGGQEGAAAVYGVGEPVTVQLSRPVHDRAARASVEHGLRVTSQPAVTGAWHWVDDSTLHFRPQQYWPAHAAVQVAFDAQGRHIRPGLYGGAPSRISFRTGDRVEALVDAVTDHMEFRRNGRLVRTLPVTTGKPGFETRNGVKVVLGQEAEVRMDGETVGIAAGSSEAYSLDVQWATRVTWSGEYVHAAPWSVAAQGHANVSHGCTGMSTEDAHWFYGQVRLGDIVRVVRSNGHMMEPFGNGFGDWNLTWSQWLAGSAAGQAVSTAGPPAAPVAAAGAGAATGATAGAGTAGGAAAPAGALAPLL